jgi:hypothetical protein
MSEPWVVLLIVAVWLAALVMLVGLCASAKAGDRKRITDRGDLGTPPRGQRSAGATRGPRTGMSRRPLARARRIRASLTHQGR